LVRRVCYLATHRAQILDCHRRNGHARKFVRAPFQGASTFDVIPRAKAPGYSIMPLRGNRPFAVSPFRPHASAPVTFLPILVTLCKKRAPFYSNVQYKAQPGLIAYLASFPVSWCCQGINSLSARIERPRAAAERTAIMMLVAQSRSPR
jgi:hypothetical protein